VSTTAGTGIRLAVVLSHPTQYYSPWFRWLREHTSLQFKVFYLWDFGVTPKRDPHFDKTFEWDVDLLSGYDCEFVPNSSGRPGAEHFFGFRNPELTRRLSEWRPGALLVFGYKWASHIRAITWARMSAVPVIFRGDSHLIGRGSPRIPVRIALGALFSQFASFLYVGAANREYFSTFGVPERKLRFSPHSVDESLFDPSKPANLSGAERLRADLRLSAKMVVLFAGKLVAAKQPMELLIAFAEINPPDAVLLIVGDGPEKARLQSYASAHANRPEVRFLPFTNQTDMPALYLSAEIFALPSRGLYETWGLAVNEAMHMGVPCLVSDRVGSQRDLVTHGETGWVFEAAEPTSLKKALSQALEDSRSPSQRTRLKEGVTRRISGYTYAQTTEGLMSALAGLAGGIDCD
jgi:glycosyltransferase involved in cell wall biosynthesis